MQRLPTWRMHVDTPPPLHCTCVVCVCARAHALHCACIVCTRVHVCALPLQRTCTCVLYIYVYVMHFVPAFFFVSLYICIHVHATRATRVHVHDTWCMCTCMTHGACTLCMHTLCLPAFLCAFARSYTFTHSARVHVHSMFTRVYGLLSCTLLSHLHTFMLRALRSKNSSVS